MTRARLEAIIGGVVLGAIAIGLTVILTVGGVTVPSDRIYVVFKDVNFLDEGAVVRSSGVMVGMVEEMELLSDGVLARLVVDGGFTVHPGYRVEVRSISILGGRFVEIRRGDQRRPAIPSTRRAPLAGDVEPSLVEPIVTMIEEAEPMLEEAIANFNETLDKLNEAQGTLGKLVSDPELGQSFERVGARLDVTSRQLRGMLGKMEEGGGTLGRLLREPRFARAVEAAQERLGSISGKLSEGQGPLGALTGDDELSEAIASAGEHLTAVIEGLTGDGGLFGAEARAEKWRADLGRTVRHLDTIVTKVSEGRGPLLVLLREEGVADDLRRTSEHLAAIADAPESSTLARFARDRRALSDFEEALLDFREVGTDLSEATPVTSSLAGILRQGFGIEGLKD